MDEPQTALERYWRHAWLELKQPQSSGWSDTTRLEFEKNYLFPLNTAMNQYLISLKTLYIAIDEVEKFAKSLNLK